jgi:hypothetical protein
MGISVGELHWQAILKFRDMQAIEIGETLTDGTSTKLRRVTLYAA